MKHPTLVRRLEHVLRQEVRILDSTGGEDDEAIALQPSEL